MTDQPDVLHTPIPSAGCDIAGIVTQSPELDRPVRAADGPNEVAVAVNGDLCIDT